MRTVTVATLVGLGSALVSMLLPLTSIVARAADLDYGVLRGPDYEPEPPRIDWSGTYFGAQGGFTSATAPFKSVYQPLIAQIVTDPRVSPNFGTTTALSSRARSADGGSFGAYAGYNFAYDDTVLGFEVDYTRFSTPISTTTSISQANLKPGFGGTASLTGNASRRIEDYGTVRVRAGYAIGSFLPFVTAGIAIGRMQIADNVQYRESVSPTIGPIVSRNRSKVLGGVALGAGLEYALTPNIVLRGEYQYVMFNDFNSNDTVVNGVTVRQGIVNSISTVRGGAAVKF